MARGVLHHAKLKAAALMGAGKGGHKLLGNDAGRAGSQQCPRALSTSPGISSSCSFVKWVFLLLEAGNEEHSQQPSLNTPKAPRITRLTKQ